MGFCIPHWGSRLRRLRRGRGAGTVVGTGTIPRSRYLTAQLCQENHHAAVSYNQPFDKLWDLCPKCLISMRFFALLSNEPQTVFWKASSLWNGLSNVTVILYQKNNQNGHYYCTHGNHFPYQSAINLTENQQKNATNPRISWPTWKICEYIFLNVRNN